MRMSNNVVRPITMTNGFLALSRSTLNFVSYRLKHLAIFIKVGKTLRLIPQLFSFDSEVLRVRYRFPSIKQRSAQTCLSFYLMQRIIYVAELHR